MEVRGSESRRREERKLKKGGVFLKNCMLPESCLTKCPTEVDVPEYLNK